MADETQGATATEPTDKEKWEAQQREAALSQGLDPDSGAVAEQRPTAATSEGASDSPLTQRLKDEGVISDEPMGYEEHAKAASSAQAKKAEKASAPEAGYFIGSKFLVTKGDHRDRYVALTRVSKYRSDADRLLVATGSVEQNFLVPEEIECRAIGDDRDGELLVLNVDEAGLERLPESFRVPGRGRG